jgi:hypothetical protein
MNGYKQRIIATLVFSFVASAVLIVHGIFFDVDWSQIKRLTIEGFFITFVLTFFILLILEKIFLLEEDAKIMRLGKRVSRLQKREERLERRLKR